MFATFNRSLNIAKTTFSVMKQDPEMVGFALLGAISSVLFMAALLVPTIILQFVGATTSEVAFGVIQYLALFFVYFGLAFIATFFNTCVVYTAKVRFEGGDATFGQSLKFAFTRLPQIAAWSAVAASVGLFLKMLDNAARRNGGVVGMILRGLLSVMGFAWSVMTLFVVPAMVYDGVGPIEAIKRSSKTLKQTWGESLARHFGFGLLQFLVSLPGWLGFFVAFALAGTSVGLGLTVGCLCVAYLIVVTLVFQVANSVFNTALFHYARSGQPAGSYDARMLQSAIGVAA
ncbi:MAG: DUF6159 family protein [Polyangiales bacterium]